MEEGTLVVERRYLSYWLQSGSVVEELELAVGDGSLCLWGGMLVGAGMVADRGVTMLVWGLVVTGRSSGVFGEQQRQCGTGRCWLGGRAFLVRRTNAGK